MELAFLVDQNNGSLEINTCAKKLRKSKSGPFLSLISACVKYGILENKHQQLSTTLLFKNIYSCKSIAEKMKFAEVAINSISLFLEINRNKESKEPISLENILSSKYGVPLKDVKRLKKVILENQYYLINKNDVVSQLPFKEDLNLKTPIESLKESNTASPESEFFITLTSLNLNLSMRVSSKEDLSILESVLKKMEKILNTL